MQVTLYIVSECFQMQQMHCQVFSEVARPAHKFGLFYNLVIVTICINRSVDNIHDRCLFTDWNSDNQVESPHSKGDIN